MPQAATVIRTTLAGCALAALALPVAAVSSKALANDPCLLLPTATVAALFDAPKAEIKQHARKPSKLSLRARCEVEWSGTDRTLSAEATIQLLDSKKRAVQRFKSNTRSVSSEEMAKAAQALREHLAAADKSGKTQKTERTKRTEGSIIDALAKNPVEFEDVKGIGDEARQDRNEGKLVVRKGTAIITLTAYAGPDMPVPERVDVNSIIKAAKAWQKKISPIRKQQTLQLAEAVAKQLK